MAKIIIFFPGTFESPDNYSSFMGKAEHYKESEETVIRIVMKGSQNSEINGYPLSGLGWGLIRPSLHDIAIKLAKCFAGKKLDIENFRRKFKNGCHSICIRRTPLDSEKNITNFDITSAALVGFSRGAIIAYYLARELGKETIITDIIANQPVQGPTHPTTIDLRDCQNIRSALTFYGNYHSKTDKIFRQSIVLLPQETQVNNWLIPINTHAPVCPIIDFHIHERLEAYQYCFTKPIMNCEDYRFDYTCHPYETLNKRLKSYVESHFISYPPSYDHYLETNHQGVLSNGDQISFK